MDYCPVTGCTTGIYDNEQLCPPHLERAIELLDAEYLATLKHRGEQATEDIRKTVERLRKLMAEAAKYEVKGPLLIEPREDEHERQERAGTTICALDPHTRAVVDRRLKEAWLERPPLGKYRKTEEP